MLEDSELEKILKTVKDKPTPVNIAIAYSVCKDIKDNKKRISYLSELNNYLWNLYQSP
jgi:uncharacterized protein YeeX (DUF496 family)